MSHMLTTSIFYVFYVIWMVKGYRGWIWLLTDLTWIGSDVMMWSDGIGYRIRIGPRVQVFRTYHNHGYEYVRVTSFKVLSIVVYFALFTVVLQLYCCYVKGVLPNQIKKENYFYFITFSKKLDHIPVWLCSCTGFSFL